MAYTKYPVAIAKGAESAQTLAAFAQNRRRVREEQEQLDLEDFIASLDMARAGQITLGMF